MSIHMKMLLRTLYKANKRMYGAMANVQTIQQEERPSASFYTCESNPLNHNEHHLNKFYTMPLDIHNTLFQHNAIPNEFKYYIKTFNECGILIRKPAIEIISCLNETDYKRPINKYVIYGKHGTGKSITLLHILHYAFMKKMVIIHVPWVHAWYTHPKEFEKSPLNPDLVDLPVDAGLWLVHFKTQNEALLTELNLKTTRDYEWNQWESTPKGTTILELIKFGANRIKFSCGVVSALLNELKLASIAGLCRTLVAIDGYNTFLADYTRVFNEDKVRVSARQISLTKPFIDFTKADWCNGAVVLTVDTRATKYKRESEYPVYLLGKEGFELLDPFIPILTDTYTENEFACVIEYYKYHKWIRNITKSAQVELKFLSNKNPLLIMDYCKAL